MNVCTLYNYVFYSLASLGSMVELHRSLSMGSGASLTPPPRVIRYSTYQSEAVP